MNSRQQKGKEIASLSLVSFTDDVDGWHVRSQSGTGRYKVHIEADKLLCTCPDFRDRGVKCKHMYAVEYWVLQGMDKQAHRSLFDANLTQSVAPATKTRVSYSQRWPAYNAAQTNEKRHFLELLHDLCSGIEQPVQALGRPRLPYSDMIFSAAFKVYSTVSGRRFASDLADAFDKGYLSKAPHYNSIFNYLEMPELTGILQELIQRSSLPLRAVETDFCVDSSGFGSSRFVKWHDVKHKGERSMHDWVKLHVMCGVQTNVVTSVEITDRHGSDTRQFPGLVYRTAENFAIREVAADKAYSNRYCTSAVNDVGGTPYIAFKSNAKGTGSHKLTRARGGGDTELWSRMYHYYSLNKDEFLAHYHKRSNAESTFSMIKAKFGDGLRSKTPVAQINEVLCKVLCHNICVVIQSVYELGIEPAFCAKTQHA